MDATKFINSLMSEYDYRGQAVHVETIPPREACYAPLVPPVAPALSSSLEQMGITELYTHQAEAVSRVRAGQDVVVVTSTASGKTLCYNIPVIEALMLDSGATALYIFPTKHWPRTSKGGGLRALSSLSRAFPSSRGDL